MRKEIVQEIFFEAPTIDARGVTIPAPQEALLFHQAFLNGWFKDYPDVPDVVPSVGLHPVRTAGREGYVVQKMLVHKDKS